MSVDRVRFLAQADDMLTQLVKDASESPISTEWLMRYLEQTGKAVGGEQERAVFFITLLATAIQRLAAGRGS